MDRALYLSTSAGTININNCTITDNTHTQVGTVSLNGNANNIIINDCLWSNNNALGGGGIYISGKSNSLSIYDNQFDSNTVTDEGAGVFVFGGSSQVNIERCTFNNNTAKVGGGFSFQSFTAGNFYISNSSFTLNDAPQGAGLSFDTTSPVRYMYMENTQFIDNVSQRGAIYLPSSAVTSITDSKFWRNQGSAIYGELLAGNITCSHLNFINNTANQGGSLSLNGVVNSINVYNSTFIGSSASTLGGDLSIELRSNLLNITNCSFSESNSGLRGGAVSIGASAVVQNFIMNNAIMNDCSSLFGSGVAVAGSCKNISIYNSNFTNNIAQYEGAALYTIQKSVNNLNIYNSIFKHNSASSGGAIKFTGGSTAKITIYESNFYENEGTSGGALMVQQSISAIDIEGCTFGSNSASNGGDTIIQNNH